MYQSGNFLRSGRLAEDDPTASEAEKSWEREFRSRNPFTLNFPRVRVCSHQVWPGEGPAMYSRFDVQTGTWEIHDELPFIPQTDGERQQHERRDGDGLFWLTRDCGHDDKDINWRWSRSDAFENATESRQLSGYRK
jgi:hypothetical protein